MPRDPNYRFCVAPRFANPLPWQERLQVGSAPAWRLASEAECAQLIANDATDESWQRDICLFSIPEHLRVKWWDLAAKQLETQPARPDSMEPFAKSVVEFAQFKRVPLPCRCAFDVTLTAPQDQQTPTAAALNAPVVARINLGDERTALVFSNAATGQLADKPLVRLVLHRGEGVWLPSSDVIYSVDGSGKADLDVWLILKNEG